MAEVVVPTADGVATSYWCRRLLRCNAPVLIASTPGGAQGKRTVLLNAIAQLSPPLPNPTPGVSPASLIEARRAALLPSTATLRVSLQREKFGASRTSSALRSALQPIGNGYLAPGPGTKKLVVFLEDVSVASCGSFAVLRRLVETNKIFGPAPKQDTFSVKATTVCATSCLRPQQMDLYGGGGSLGRDSSSSSSSSGGLEAAMGHVDRGERSGEGARVMRHFSVLWKGPLGATDVTTVCRTLIAIHYLSNKEFPRPMKETTEPLAKVLLSTLLSVSRRDEPRPCSREKSTLSQFYFYFYFKIVLFCFILFLFFIRRSLRFIGI